MPLSDAGKLKWGAAAASSYVFVKDFNRIVNLRVDPFEDFERADDGTLRFYQSAIIKRTIELEFDDIGATQRNQFATIWKDGNIRGNLDFYIKQTDAAKEGTFAWLGGFGFTLNDWGMYYKNLFTGRIILEEI